MDQLERSLGVRLKLHAAGYLWSDGSFYKRGDYGHYWSGTQIGNFNGWDLHFRDNTSEIYLNEKTMGFSARCLRE